MKTLVTGGAGFVGMSLVNDLLARSIEVRVLDKARGDLDALRSPALEVVEAGIEDPKAVSRAAKGIDVIYHLAETFSSDPYEIIDVDIRGNVNLLESAVENGVKHFFFVSTHRVYGKPRYVPMDEEHPLRPEESRRPMYSVSKLAREQLCLTFWRERGLPATIFRWFYSISPDRALQGRALTTLIDSVIRNEPIRVPGRGGGDFFLVDDAVLASRLATLNERTYGETFNLTSGLYVSWREIAEMVCELATSTSTLESIAAEEWKGSASFSSDPTLSFECALDIGKAERLMGYGPRHSQQEVMDSLRESADLLVQARKKG
jgi:nucleoside-diphosphate-sugar epimerase